MSPLSLGQLRIDRIVEDAGPFMPLDVLIPAITAEDRALNGHWLEPRFIDPASGFVNMSFHSFVVRTGRHTILVDACAGNDKERPLRPNWHRQNRPYLATLRAAGVAPEAIDFVFCTHLHADHVGWNTQLVDGRWVPTFPNAQYLFHSREYEFWEKANREARAAGQDLPNHGAFADSVLPVVDAGRAVFVAGDHEIETGVHLEPAYGHTAGACMLHAKNGAGHALFVGDAMHTAAQLIDPARLSSKFCDDPAQSGRTRRAICERYADTATVILTGHFPTPTAGRIVAAGAGFRFTD